MTKIIFISPSLGRDTLGLGTLNKTLGLGTPGRLWGWALRGHSGDSGHSRETRLGTPGTIWGWHTLALHLRKVWAWALQRYSGAGHSGTLSGWALQGDSKVGHGVTPERLSDWDSGWALQGHIGLGTPGMSEE